MANLLHPPMGYNLSKQGHTARSVSRLAPPISFASLGDRALYGETPHRMSFNVYIATILDLKLLQRLELNFLPISYSGRVGADATTVNPRSSQTSANASSTRYDW
jgi:hypothetical protein